MREKWQLKLIIVEEIIEKENWNLLKTVGITIGGKNYQWMLKLVGESMMEMGYWHNLKYVPTW